MSQDEGKALRITDLIVAEPRLKVVGSSKGDRSFAGLCAEGDGDISGWLVFPERGGTPFEACRRLGHSAGLVYLEGEVRDEDLAAAQSQIPLLLGSGQLTRLDVRNAVDHLLSRQPNLQAWRKLQTTATLSQALMSPAPESALLGRYSSISGDALLLLDLDGQVLASAGTLPARSVARVLRGEGDSEPILSIGRWTASARLVTAGASGKATGRAWWLVRGRRADTVPNLSEPSFVAFQELLLGLLTARKNMESSQLADSSSLLSGLCGESADKDELEEALVGRGFSRRAHLRLLVAGTANDSFRSETVHESADVAASHGVPLLVGYRKGRTLALTTESDAVPHIASTLPGPVGVSASFLGVDRGPLAWREATVAAVVAEKRGMFGQHSLTFEQCGALERAVALLGKEGLDDAVAHLDAAIREVKGGEEIFEALEAAQFSVARAAKNVGVHANTVRNRIEELEKLVAYHDADLVLWALWRRVVIRER